MHLGEEVIMEHEEAATSSGRMALSLVAHRARRSLWLVEPYPVALLRLLHTDAEVASRCFAVGTTPDRHKEAWQRARDAL